MAPPRRGSAEAEFDDYIRKLRKTDEGLRSERAACMASEILAETRKDDESLWVSYVDNFIASIQRVRAETPSGDKVLEEAVRRLQDAKLRAQK